MKKFVFTLTALALMANALAQAPFRVDTSYQTYQQFDYDAWVSEDSLMRSKSLRLLNAPIPTINNGYGPGESDVLQYNYTDNQKGLNIVGISAVIKKVPGRNTDTVCPTDYLLLYDDSAGIFQPKAQIAINTIDTSGRPRFYWSLWMGICGEEHWVNEGYASSLTRIHNYYFDEPITVYDSFYVGCSDRFMLPLLTEDSSMGYYGQPLCFLTFGLTESYYNPTGCPRPHIPWKCFSYRYPSYGWFYYDAPEFLLVMPIIEVYDTVITGPSGCPKTEGAFVRGNYSDTVTVQWDSDSLHPAHLVSWGPAGTWPNDGNIDTVWGDNKWVFSDTAYQDDYMVAYVSTLCTDWDSVRHSVWSSALSWRLHNWDMGGHDDDVGIPDDRSDLARFTHIMPNPASHTAMVASSFRIEKVEAYNAAGTKVLDQAVGALNATLDLDGWPQGAYVLLVRTATGTTAKRLVVQ